MISLTGTPYDSLQEMIGLSGDSTQSLKANGVKYEQIDLLTLENGDNDFDEETIVKRLERKDVKLVEIQRSRGYSARASLTIDKIEKIIQAIRSVNQDVIIMVDNCYGELVEYKEPGHVGADVVVGSLMKNLGGGIASTGGYVAGREDLIAMVADRLTAPGIGKNQGANFNQNNAFFKGIFMAPNAVKGALKTQIFASWMLEKLGYKNVAPKWNDKRTDIIQTVELGNEENLVHFTQGIQESSPIDSFVRVMPAPMPGYPFDEVMACGSFTNGSTIELSADAPVVPPYTLYMQGGLSFEYGKLSILLALTSINTISSAASFLSAINADNCIINIICFFTDQEFNKICNFFWFSIAFHQNFFTFLFQKVFIIPIQFTLCSNKPRRNCIHMNIWSPLHRKIMR